ncbi:MAG: HEAT repeat domain-containing protein [Methanothrix harundinacea]|nr:HEAT repeat domain-containing protein [Methanothrix harundinacea]
MSDQFAGAIRRTRDLQERRRILKDLNPGLSELAEIAQDVAVGTKFRADVVKAIASSGKGEAVNTLLDLIQDDDATVAVTAVAGLGCLADRKATEPLIRLMLDTASVVKESSPWSSGVPKDPISSQRAAAAGALGVIGDPRALGPLTWAALADPIDPVRTAARGALWRVGWNAGGQFDPVAWQLRPEVGPDRVLREMSIKAKI